MTRRVVIVGAGLAGFRAAQELRAQRYDGEVVLVGAETHPPYDRPPLSKQVLAGQWSPQHAFLGAAEGTGLDGSVELRLGTTAKALHTADHQLVVDTGEALRFDALIIATGAAPRTLPGRLPPGVHTLRTLDDCTAIRSDLLRGGPLVVVGGGFVGAEVAAVARELGLHVTIVEALAAPLERAVGASAGAMCGQIHEEHGVTVMCNVAVEGCDGSSRVERVRLSDGARLDAGLVVVGIGVRPNTGWLENSAVPLDDGVVCDEFGCADQEHRIYAAGDVASWLNPSTGRRIRVEHWTSANEQARIVAHNITHPHQQRALDAVPYFWSDQYGQRIQLVGQADPGMRTTVLTRPGGGAHRLVLFSENGALSAALGFGWTRAVALCRRVITGGGSLDEAVAQVRKAAGMAA
ncbi:NAD(P)/FAD-dependent oxidoreductase [Saccharopolyspora mangrovi]|uniref:FAD-dependent oxidoreductase n=1 Tax=Saccharopolyspora mangrovi TaxID=3082379 RepID=A0ABU6ACD4_9PSEU|nr:FAD-dependent oxidoreductase [Saccharopolyspora sp. S2-29]MEB3369185.1 FAD-dependent oxidoreductase [Saccharopolyspora sp. S2-29]